MPEPSLQLVERSLVARKPAHLARALPRHPYSDVADVGTVIGALTLAGAIRSLSGLQRGHHG